MFYFKFFSTFSEDKDLSLNILLKNHLSAQGPLCRHCLNGNLFRENPLKSLSLSPERGRNVKNVILYQEVYRQFKKRGKTQRTPNLLEPNFSLVLSEDWDFSLP